MQGSTVRRQSDVATPGVNQLWRAPTTLTGANYKVNIRKMEFTGNCLFDKNGI